MLTQLERPLSALDAIFTRRSIRSYTGQAIDQSTVRALLDAAVQAPTAMHAEPWAFVVVQDAERLEQYSGRAKAMWLHEAAKYRDLHAPGEASVHADFARRLEDPHFNVFYDAGTLIVICGKPLGSFVAADCWLAAENLMLAACALGLGTCCIGSALPALNAPDVKTDLGIPADVTPFVPIVVGVPAGEVSAVTRRDPEILCWR